MKYKDRLITIFGLFCIIKFCSIATNLLMSDAHLDNATQNLTTEVIEEKVIEANRIEVDFFVHKDDFLDILGVPVPTAGPKVTQIILHNPLLCTHDSMTLDFVIYVHSPVHNWERRQALRSTYANPKLFKSIRFQVIFFLGLSKEFGRQQMIKKEFDEYGDIVQGDFIDTRKSTTLKAVLALTWISRHCSQADYALKVDDRAFLNLFEMIPLMQQNLNSPFLVICPIRPDQSVEVLRDKRNCSKGCVSFRQFRALMYPRFCTGLCFVLSRALIPKLAEAVAKTPFFFIDDVYVTGLLMMNVKTGTREHVPFEDIGDQMELDPDVGLSILANTSVPMTKHLFNTSSAEEIVSMWQLLLNRLTEEQREMINLSADATHNKTSLTNLLRAKPIRATL